MMAEAALQRIAGLTGGIASGKSTVAGMLAEAGAHVLDADRIARQVVRPQTPAWQAIVARFGSAILQPDGQIDRVSLGALVFQDADAKASLERIVHPRVREVMTDEMHRLAARHPADLVVLDVPLLIESGWHAWLPAVILVYVPEAVQKSRLMRRDGLRSAEADARMRAQMPLDQKRAYADYIIDNTGSRDATRRQVRDVYRRIMAAQRPPPPPRNAAEP